jgi:hypothetical protein
MDRRARARLQGATEERATKNRSVGDDARPSCTDALVEGRVRNRFSGLGDVEDSQVGKDIGRKKGLQRSCLIGGEGDRGRPIFLPLLPDPGDGFGNQVGQFGLAKLWRFHQDDPLSGGRLPWTGF